ncbi:MAG: hypothetical protein LQ346_004590 [Caloplaca aetnensis]|nr:MAG: hypothetical protein LQ346_004590 [Caloplaca aetnensis]
MSFPKSYQNTTISSSYLTTPDQTPTANTHGHPQSWHPIQLPPTHPLSLNHPNTRLPIRKPRKQPTPPFAPNRVSKRVVAKPTPLRKEPSLLKTTLAKNTRERQLARSIAADEKSRLGGTTPSPFPQTGRPQERAAPSNIPDTNSGAADGIEWERWINLDMCGVDSTAEPGYAEAAPPRNMVVRPVEFRGNHGLVVGS